MRMLKNPRNALRSPAKAGCRDRVPFQD